LPANDIRWIQRYHNFTKALSQLDEAVQLSQHRPLSKLEEQGLIQSFEYTHELAWKTLKDFLQSRGIQELYGAKDVTREAFKQGLLSDGTVWMQMIASRNLTSHTYDEATAATVASSIIQHYAHAFVTLRETMKPLLKEVS